MKILIMVLSYNKYPYDLLMKTQQETWDTVNVEGVNTVYYYGGVPIDPPPYPHFTHVKTPGRSVELVYQITDEYYYMAGKFKEGLGDVLSPSHNEFLDSFKGFDFIFRTNSSSYINKKRLLEFAETLPKEKCYAGWNVFDSNSEDKGMAVSGAGIWLSRDCAEILREKIDPKFEMEEDIYIGRILRENGIVPIDDKSRVDINHIIDGVPDTYHYRFKGEHGSRLVDVANMKRMHNYLIETYR